MDLWPIVGGAIFATLVVGCGGGNAPNGASSSHAQPSPNPATPVEAAETSVGIGARAASAAEPPLRIIVGGDLLPHRPSLISPAAIGGALAPLAPLFGKADAAIANYEAATGEVDDKTARLAYAAPRGWLSALHDAGLKGVTVANNHTCDLGESGLSATLEAAPASGMLALGGDARDPWAPQVLAMRGNHTVCAVAWTTLMNAQGGCSHSKQLAVAPPGRVGNARIDRAIARSLAECDATVAVFHGGQEYVPQTSTILEQAKHAAESGADAVVIHHPHVASPIVVHETRDGRKVPIFASVGNLATNQGESWKPSMFPVMRTNRRLVCVNGWTRLGVLADLSFSFSDESVRLDWGFHLSWTDNQHAQDRNVAVPKIEARLLDPTADRVIIDKLREDSSGPNALFSDPCWFERAGANDARCSATFAHTSRFSEAAAMVEPVGKAPAAKAKRPSHKRSSTRR